jgi:GntR family transcriptional regulator
MVQGINETLRVNGRRRAPRSGPTPPFYLQVVRALKDEIVTGVHPVGSQLPTEEELCERFSVSRYTVRKASRRLREDNLVSSRQGAGTIVVPPARSTPFQR